MIKVSSFKTDEQKISDALDLICRLGKPNIDVIGAISSYKQKLHKVGIKFPVIRKVNHGEYRGLFRITGNIARVGDVEFYI